LPLRFVLHSISDRLLGRSQVRRELVVQRSNLSHRLAKLEHSDSISAAERVSLQGALAAEKRRADKLQRQMDRMVLGERSSLNPHNPHLILMILS